MYRYFDHVYIIISGSQGSRKKKTQCAALLGSQIMCLFILTLRFLRSSQISGGSTGFIWTYALNYRLAEVSSHTATHLYVQLSQIWLIVCVFRARAYGICTPMWRWTWSLFWQVNISAIFFLCSHKREVNVSLRSRFLFLLWYSGVLYVA